MLFIIIRLSIIELTFCWAIGLSDYRSSKQFFSVYQTIEYQTTNSLRKIIGLSIISLRKLTIGQSAIRTRKKCRCPALLHRSLDSLIPRGWGCLRVNNTVAEFIDPWLGDKVKSGIGLSCWPASHVAWRAGTTTPCQSWTLSPQSGIYEFGSDEDKRWEPPVRNVRYKKCSKRIVNCMNEN
jgi:hypothetical protein